MSSELPTLQDLLQRDAEKIAEIKRSKDKSKIEPEWLLLAEFGMYFGWQAVQDARADKISFAEMNKLLAASRRLDSMNRYNKIMDNYAVTIAPHDKSKSLKQTLKGIRDTWQIQQ